MAHTRPIRDLRDPRHPANRRLIRSAGACLCVGLILCVGSLVGTLPFAIGWPTACVFIFVSASLSLRYRLRVRALTRFEMLRSVLVAVLITLAIGIGLPTLLGWFIEHVAQPR